MFSDTVIFHTRIEISGWRVFSDYIKFFFQYQEMERTIFYHHITILEHLHIVNYRVFTKSAALYQLKLECACSMNSSLSLKHTGILRQYRKKPPKIPPIPQIKLSFSFIVQWCFVHKYITPPLSKDNTTYNVVDELSGLVCTIWCQHTVTTGQTSAFHECWQRRHGFFQVCIVVSSSSLTRCCSGLFAQKSSQEILIPDNKRNHPLRASLQKQQQAQLQNCAWCFSLQCFKVDLQT